jgi:hypothetical protein
MRKRLIVPSIALAASMVLAVPAIAQGGPVGNDQLGDPGEIVLTADGDVPHPPEDDTIVLVSQRRPAETLLRADDFIDIASLRLPTLGDLSKERWNQVHRRYDSGRGRREKIRA